MPDQPEIASLWIGGRLSWLEQLCLKSFADAGHPTTLYSYAHIDNLPEGVTAGDAAKVFPAEPMLRHARTGSPAIHADLWRLHLLAQTDAIWVDADMYCHRPFDPEDGYLFGWEKPGLVCNAVLALPRQSAALRNLLAFFDDPYAIAPWLKPWQRRELEAERDAGTPVHLTEQTWGFTGPAAVTYFLQQSSEIAHARPQAAFYPISFPHRNRMILSRFDAAEALTPETRGVHFWARRMKPRLQERESNRPQAGSYMHGLLRKHGIDPSRAPIPAKPKTLRTAEEARTLRRNLRADARDLGLSRDQLSRKYRVERGFVRHALAQEDPAPDNTLLACYLGTAHFLQTVHLSAEGTAAQPFLYMKNHKAACSHVLATLMTYQLGFLGGDPGGLTHAKLHKPPKALMLSGKRSLTEEMAQSALRDATRFRFTVVRDPTERTLAAWADRIRGGHRQKDRLMRHIGRAPEDTLSLSAFLDVLAQDNSARDLDRHWRPQSSDIAYGRVRYDHIGDVANLAATASVIATTCFALPEGTEAPRHLWPGPAEDVTELRAMLTAADLRNLERAFAQDYVMCEEVRQSS
ncbi:sulfotransferase family 2 domain-containing protein [uncultured Roseobacter sp.]|uniref:sulfotransferase family 2 domain-containing protein n=1 Tax=uncultured Roseobacter sp. TaxID=114847 RepID=UPI002616936B|nr:sulfotransferase family 2 domain-containing protein [uncultured Roseobacter sp.]